MPRICIAKLRYHRVSGQGFVELNGRRHYLGASKDPATHRKYLRAIAEWEAAGRQPPCDPQSITVVELVDRFWGWARSYYCKRDGTPTGERDNSDAVNCFRHCGYTLRLD